MKKTIHNLSQSPYVFDNTSGNISGRFQLFAANNLTGIGEPVETGGISITYINGHIHVESNMEDPIRKIGVFNILGQSVYQRAELNTSDWEFNILLRNQVVIVKSKTNKGTQTQKIKISG